MSGASPFSRRILRNKNIKAHSGPEGLVLAVADQLLICESLPFDIEKAIAKLHGSAKQLTSILEGLGPVPPGVEDVFVYEVKLPPNHNIFSLTVELRKNLKPQDKGKVSPNHVLVPAVADDHSCPWGAPKQASPGQPFPSPNGQVRHITIIDSGYQWKPGFGPNPLQVRGWFSEGPAERVNPNGGWVTDAPDVLSVRNNGILDALAGHANFIAGIIAHRCRGAEITIRNHNGGFAPNAQDFPTEAAVARSLCRSRNAHVINLGFAFSAFQNITSCAWEVAFEFIGSGTAGAGPLVVAPAGNQNSNHPRYPAALQGTYSNLIAVASLSRAQPGASGFVRSNFSNFGPWVTCAARGSNIRSTFLPVKMKVEDDEAQPRQARDFRNGWALWNGTSFATPRVVAAIASRIVPGTTPPAAWAALKATGTKDNQNRLGFRLRDADL